MSRDIFRLLSWRKTTVSKRKKKKKKKKKTLHHPAPHIVSKQNGNYNCLLSDGKKAILKIPDHVDLPCFQEFIRQENMKKDVEVLLRVIDERKEESREFLCIFEDGWEEWLEVPDGHPSLGIYFAYRERIVPINEQPQVHGFEDMSDFARHDREDEKHVIIDPEIWDIEWENGKDLIY